MDESDLCSPPDEPPHEPRLISQGPIGQVALCGCGHLHLNLQYLTLRFEPAAFRELAVLLVQAQRRLDADPSVRAAQGPASHDACPGVH
jgi:hypothetical protein